MRFNRHPARTGTPDDDGAILIFALLLITTVALVLTALMSSVDTNERATVSLRGVAAATYDGDAAAQVAVNTLRKGTWNNASGAGCFGGAVNSLTLANFYPATTGGTPSSAYVSCAGETGTGAQGTPVPISAANKPGNAVLTLGTSPLEDGQTYGQSSATLGIRGGVVSDSTIKGKNNTTLNVTGGAQVRSVAGCTNLTVTPACTPIAAPGITDPNYAAPPASLVTPPTSVPTCQNKKVAEFQPGLYTSAALLNNCDASKALMHFNPGVYFFDFADTGSGSTHVWTTTTTTVGGTPTSTLNGASPPTAPGTCINPILSTTAVGVTFVFGGDSQLAFGKNSNFEICASYAPSWTSIPTAIYGLKSTLTNGAYVARGEFGCVVAVNGCDLLSIASNGVQPSFFVEGFAYAPLASVNLAVTNAAQPYFNFGVVLRKLTLSTTASASGAAYISLPDDSPGYGTADTIADLTVYVCPGAATCDATGRLKLRARVRINDPSGTPVAGQRQITVLSWTLLA